MRRSRPAILIGLVGVLTLASIASAAARPTVHAHRGGSLHEGKPLLGENTLPALRRAAEMRFVLEFDVKLTADGVPVVFHDATLERATGCTGEIAAKTLSQLSRCKVDIIGTTGKFRQLPAGDRRRAAIPTLRSVLRMIGNKRARANIEIKNQPPDPDYDSTERFATIVSRTIKNSGVPQRRLIIQSFNPANLDVARRILPNAQLSYLSLDITNPFAIGITQSRGYDWVSPQWPVDRAFVNDAHAAGLKVVPFTIDNPRDVRAARAIGVDALITNDPTRARRVLQAPAP